MKKKVFTIAGIALLIGASFISRADKDVLQYAAETINDNSACTQCRFEDGNGKMRFGCKPIDEGNGNCSVTLPSGNFSCGKSKICSL